MPWTKKQKRLFGAACAGKSKKMDKATGCRLLKHGKKKTRRRGR